MKREQIDGLWRDDTYWTAGIIYHCAEDPRVIVPRRWRWGGWTLNFAHPRVGRTGITAFLLAVGPGMITLWLTGSTQATLAAMLASIVALMYWAHRESTRYR